MRGDDFDAVPQCGICHRPGPSGEALHDTGLEREWWEKRGIDPYALAAALELVSGDLQAGRAIVLSYRNGSPP